MKGIKTTNITTGVRMPFGKRSLDYLQSSYKDTIAELCRAVGIVDTATVLHGCDVTVDGDNYTYSSGAICYNGEVYKVEAGALTVEPGHTAVWVIVTEFPSSLNPVLFSDGNLRDVHYENKMILQSGASGSGVADWNEVARRYVQEYIDSPTVNASNITTPTARLNCQRHNEAVKITFKVTGRWGTGNGYSFRIKVPERFHFKRESGHALFVQSGVTVPAIVGDYQVYSIFYNGDTYELNLAAGGDAGPGDGNEVIQIVGEISGITV